MKILFLLVCCVCAFSFSALSIIVGTGEIPGKEKPSEEKKGSAVQLISEESLSVFSGDEDVVDKLKNELTKERESYEAKKIELNDEEKKIQHKETVMTALKDEIEKMCKIG